MPRKLHCAAPGTVCEGQWLLSGPYLKEGRSVRIMISSLTKLETSCLGSRLEEGY